MFSGRFDGSGSIQIVFAFVWNRGETFILFPILLHWSQCPPKVVGGKGRSAISEMASSTLKALKVLCVGALMQPQTVTNGPKTFPNTHILPGDIQCRPSFAVQVLVLVVLLLLCAAGSGDDNTPKRK